MPDTIPPVVFARTIADRTDDEVFAYSAGMDLLDSRSRSIDRLAYDRIRLDVTRRARELAAVLKIGCSRDACLYPQRVGLVAGVDVSIDGDVWPNSPYAKHIDRCPWHQAGHRETVVAMYTSEQDRADARGEISLDAYRRAVEKGAHLLDPPLTEQQAVDAANAGARSVWCVKCERGHDGECTGPTPILTIEVHPGPDPATMDAIRRVRTFQQQADRDGYGRS